jgi:hypothetical protein
MNGEHGDPAELASLNGSHGGPGCNIVRADSVAAMPAGGPSCRHRKDHQQ